MKYAEFEKMTSQVDGTCVVYDSPSNRFNYVFAQRWEVLDNIPMDADINIVPISRHPEVKQVMMENYEAEMKPAEGVVDDGFDEMMESFNNGSLYLGVWSVDEETTYMLIYDYNPAAENSIRIGQRIQALRKEAGLTQTQLAEKCGMAQPNIARIEAGTYATSIDVLSRIADALGKRIELV